MKKIKSIEKLTNLKFVNIYQITYELENGKELRYYVASRRSMESLECKTPKVDAVRVLPYVKREGKIYVVITREFRPATGKYIYGTPAGLVDEGETGAEAMERELKEEIGAKVISSRCVQKASYSSAGLTDETIECYEAEVELAYEQELDDTEDIELGTIELSKLPDFMQSHDFCLQSALMLQSFYFAQQFRENQEENE